MLDYLEYLKESFDFPIILITVIVLILFVINIIGELLEFKGKVVPEFMKIRKYFARKKKERETLAEMPAMMNEMKEAIASFNKHYSDDNITMRDKWIYSVDERLNNNEHVVQEINKKIDENSEALMKLVVDNKRETIISFADKVSNYDFPVTREQFTRIDRIYQEYEDIIEKRGFKNGEIEVAHRMIEEAYQYRLKNHTFIEDVRWHGLEQQG